MASMDEMKQAIVDYLTKAKKSKHYFNDLVNATKKQYPDVGMREVKKACNALVADNVVAYFMTGSTTMYTLTSRQGETTTQDDA